MKIEGERLRIRNFRLTDLWDFYGNIKDKEIGKWMDMIPYPYKKTYAIKFILANIVYTLLKRKPRQYLLGIALKENDKIIGEAKLFLINYTHKSAEMGYWIGKKYWGQGFAAEINNLIQTLAFEQLGLNKIYSKVYKEHIVARKVLEKCGFKLEATLRKAAFKNNRWYDKQIYGKTNSEYASDS